MACQRGQAVSSAWSARPALALHWNGAAWKRSGAPSSRGSALDGVGIVSAADIWAVGPSSGKTLTLRWNGTAWHRVPSPGPAGSTLSSVAAVSAGNGWAVGTISRDGNAHDKSLVLHWTGRAWKRVRSPGPGGPCMAGADGPYAVAASSARSAWAVGDSYKFPSTFKTLVLRWNGASWKQVAAPSPAGSHLWGVAAVSASDAWAVGASGLTSQKTMILHWNGKAWSRQ
ncbi:MAG: hypothetical protein ACRDRJ_51815 [Streptosporangiaceae bacterium]